MNPPQNSSLWVTSYSGVSSSYSVVPPSLHWRGPDSVKCDAPSLVSFSDPRFRHSTWIKTANMPELSCWWRDNWDWRAVCVSPLIYSFCSRVLLPGCSVVCSLSARRMMVPGRRVWRETRSQSPHWCHLRWSKQSKDMFPGHKHTPQVNLVRLHNGFQQKLYIIQN